MLLKNTIISCVGFNCGFAISKNYDNFGFLYQIRKADNNQLIWQLDDMNQYGQINNFLEINNRLCRFRFCFVPSIGAITKIFIGITHTTLGNGLSTQYNFDPNNHTLTSIITPGIQNYQYQFQSQTGNLLSRDLDGHSQQFTYDNLDRLTQVQGYDPMTITYDDNGNILSNSICGQYTYSTAKPHAIATVSNNTAVIPETPQNITYTAFNKVREITEGDYKLTFTYNSSYDRKKTQLYENGSLIKTKYFFGAYEKEITPEGTRELNYITSPDGIVALYEVRNGTGRMFYLHKDHLGSITEITDQAGNLVQKFYYNAWGIRQTLVNTIGRTITDRGYTGHEHLAEFNLINMNGRVYDPMLGRFLSTDNYVQLPNFTQSFNRYAYAFNNPLKYTDPSGEIVGTIFTFFWDLGTTIFVKGGIDPWNTSANRQQAWRDFDPTASWSKTNKAWKIDKGLIKTDENRSFFGRAFQLGSRFTRELPQTVLGNLASHGRNIIGQVDQVEYFGGATIVNDDDPGTSRWGFTLGLYINSKNIRTNNLANDNLFRHEYGHVLQSMLLGRNYLKRVGIPSLFGAFLDYNIGINNHDREWYETQANRMSFRYFSNHVPNNLNSATGGSSWNNIGYPTQYNPNYYWLIAHPPVEYLWWLLF